MSETIDSSFSVDETMRMTCLLGYGAAVSSAQTLEFTLASVIVADTAVREGFASVRDFDKRVQTLTRVAFGDLVKMARQRSLTTPELGKRLNRAVRDRNRLAHWYFPERMAQMETIEGRLYLIEELEEIVDRLQQISRDLKKLLDTTTTQGRFPSTLRSAGEAQSGEALAYLAQVIREARASPRPGSKKSSKR